MKLMDVTLRESIYYGSGIDYSQGLEYLEHFVRFVSPEDMQMVEVGYLNTDIEGHLNYKADYLAEAMRICGDRFEVVAMCHPGRVDTSLWDLNLISQLKLVRIVCNGTSVPEDVKTYIDILHSVGVKVSVNIAYIMSKPDELLTAMYRQALEYGADCIYFADSSGSAMPADMIRLCKLLSAERKDNLMGFHLHDHMQMATANALVAEEYGIDMMDSSITGAGKGGGNLKTEMFIPTYKYIKNKEMTVDTLKNLYGYIQYFNRLIGREGDFYEHTYLNSLIGIFKTNLRKEEEIEKQSNGDGYQYIEMISKS